MPRPQHCQVSLYGELTRAQSALIDWADRYPFHTRAHMLRAADQLGHAAHNLVHRPESFDEAAAILEAVQPLLTLTDN